MTLPLLQERGGALSGLLQGVGQGLQQVGPSIQELILNKQKEKQKQQLLQSILPQLSAGLNNSSGESGGQGQSGLGWESLLKLQSAGFGDIASLLSPFVLDQQKNASKQHAEEQKKLEKQEYHSNILDELEALKPYVGRTDIPFTKSFNAKPGGLNRSGLEKRAEVEPLSITLEGVLRDMATKGALSNRTFEELLKRIPRSDDSEREYQGKINGFRKILKTVPKESRKAISDTLEGKGSQEGTSGSVLMRAPNGEEVPMDSVNVEEALKRGWKKL